MLDEIFSDVIKESDKLEEEIKKLYSGPINKDIICGLMFNRVLEVGLSDIMDDIEEGKNDNEVSYDLILPAEETGSIYLKLNIGKDFELYEIDKDNNVKAIKCILEEFDPDLYEFKIKRSERQFTNTKVYGSPSLKKRLRFLECEVNLMKRD